MSRTGWKQAERAAAKLIRGTRYPANTGALVDCESANFCVQVKCRQRLSLAQLERLAMEIGRIGTQKTKAGIVMVKRSAGKGRETPWLFVMDETTFRHLHGALPTQGEP